MSSWCEILVQGHLDPSWAEWFDGLALAHLETGATALRGPVADQAALHGLLAKIRDLGVPLLAVTCRERAATDDGRRTGDDGRETMDDGP
jgi:hypothetical protein